MKNIHVLPTDKPSRLIQAPNDILILLVELAENNEYNLNKHIYITSDEEIKKGDYGLVVNEILSYNKMIELWGVTQGWKIILTTDQDLIKDGVQAIDDEFLEWFVKNPSCESVEVRNKYISQLNKPSIEIYKIIIPSKEVKQDLEKEMFELEQELDIPSHLRWHNSKPKQETLDKAAMKFANDNSEIYEKSNHGSMYFGFYWGAKWQQEQFSKSEFIQKLRATLSDAEARRLIFETFKNK